MTEKIISTAPKPFIFVLMPFIGEFDDIYKFGIKGAAEDAGAYAERVDEQIFTEGILERIFNQISKADIIVADMTGRNPNVFYEVGYAHALGKIVLLLTQNADDIPFDLKHKPHTIYSGKIDVLRKELTKKLIWAINESKKQLQQNILEQFFISLFGTEIPEARFSREIPVFNELDINYFGQYKIIELPIFIRNDSPEISTSIKHIYLIISANSGFTPFNKSYKEIVEITRATLENPNEIIKDYCMITSTIFESQEGPIKQYPLNITILPLPSGAIDNFHLYLGCFQEVDESLLIRLHTPYTTYNFPFKLKFNPLNSEDYFKRATKFYFEGKHELAIKAYEKAMESEPNNVKAWFDKGIALGKLGRHDEALNAIEKAIELKPDYIEAWFSKGVALGQLGRHDEEFKAYEKAIELKPDHVNAWYNKGVRLTEHGRHDEALKVYEKAIELKPDYVNAWYNKGVSLDKLGRHDEALNAYEKIIEIKPDDADAWYNSACFYSIRDDKEKALSYLRRAIDIDITYKEKAKKDKDFEKLLLDESFKKLIE
jgi:tetratricopeptide (TPR) repeat protein